MVAGERRLETTEAALIVALVAVFAALLIPLWGKHGEPDAVAAKDRERALPAIAADPPPAELRRLEPPAATAPEASGTAAADERLAADVRAIIAEAKACAREHSSGRVKSADVTVAVQARELGTGRVALAIDDGRALRPASGMKLVTTAAALVLLGSDWHFETGFDGTGPIRDGVLQGDLVVRAGGDPLYAGRDSGEVERRLDRVADALVLRGVREVAGDLVLDLDTFDDPEPAPEWPAPSQHWQEYCALAAGLTANGGVLAARVRPTSVGERASIEVWPAAHGLERRYTTETVSEHINDVRVGATRAAVTVAGKIGISVSEVEAEFSHPDPVLLFESSLRAALERAGVEVRGSVRRVHGAPPAERLYTLRSPLRGMLVPINSYSVNGVADQVFFAMARAVTGRGSRAGGGLATARALERLGVSTEGLVQVDGSGLSRANRVSAGQMAALVAAVLSGDGETREAYLESLAVAGESGTLEDRMTEGPARGRVFAKTGWISGTSSLTGLARALDGTEWVFSILVAYPASESGLNRYCFKPMHDAIAERLVAGANS
jgi:D-alanyl-D-alanine carboxypeptidase/D-alanyl-D-alanine-endopeptidase (penicillin-binding protein 4)